MLATEAAPSTAMRAVRWSDTLDFCQTTACNKTVKRVKLFFGHPKIRPPVGLHARKQPLATNQVFIINNYTLGNVWILQKQLRREHCMDKPCQLLMKILYHLAASSKHATCTNAISTCGAQLRIYFHTRAFACRWHIHMQVYISKVLISESMRSATHISAMKYTIWWL